MIKSPSKASIILPTYNRAGLIQETIRSIRDQTYTNWELIIVDDGSTDDTEKLIAQFQDERIQFHKAGRIGVGGKIKNIGLEKTSGEWIAFIDSDDFWAPKKLEKQVAALQQNPEAGFSLTGGYNFREPGEPLEYFYKQREGLLFANVFLLFFQSKVAAFAQTLLFRRECLALTGPFKEEKSFSDIDFIASLAYHFKAVILYEPLVYRRLHNENYSTPHWEKSYYEGIGLIRSYRGKLPAKIEKNALFKLYVQFGEKCLSYKQRNKAIGCFLNAWQYKLLSIVPFKKIAKSVWYYLRSK